MVFLCGIFENGKKFFFKLILMHKMLPCRCIEELFFGDPLSVRKSTIQRSIRIIRGTPHNRIRPFRLPSPHLHSHTICHCLFSSNLRQLLLCLSWIEFRWPRKQKENFLSVYLLIPLISQLILFNKTMLAKFIYNFYVCAYLSAKHSLKSRCFERRFVQAKRKKKYPTTTTHAPSDH